MSRFSPFSPAKGGVRPPAVAGRFYPAQAPRLRAEVARYLGAAELPALPGPVAAVIAPHAGYVYSGPVAGYSFRALPDPGGRTVYLLGPAHYAPVAGIAAGPYAAMETPLGRVPVAAALVARLIEEDEAIVAGAAAHAPEHCLEVELPFLQARASEDFRIVPLLYGAGADPAAAAAVLAGLLEADPQALLVASSDLSHYHPYRTARRLDSAFLEAVVAGDLAAAAAGEACGRGPILTLMHLARRLGWQAHLLDYRNSGDTGGGRDQVVGYAAVAYTMESHLHTK